MRVNERGRIFVAARIFSWNNFLILKRIRFKYFDFLASSVRPKGLTAGNFGEIFGQFSAETVSPPLVIFGCSVFLLKIVYLAKNGHLGRVRRGVQHLG